jgi:hypothetical protein
VSHIVLLRSVVAFCPFKKKIIAIILCIIIIF